MRKRARYSFVSVANENTYKELRQLNRLPSNKRLVQNSIFYAVNKELLQVKEGVRAVYDVIAKDTELEDEQMNNVEIQLKKSLKKVRRIYKKTQEYRSENEKYEASDLIDSAAIGLNSLDETARRLEVTIDRIVDKMTQIDATFPEKNRLLSEEIFNQHHYPLFFEHMRVKCPQVLKKRPLGNEFYSRALTSEGPFFCSPNTNANDPSLRSEDEQIAESIEETISRYRRTKTKEHGTSFASKFDAFIPPTLREASLPVISTTFETVSTKSFDPSLSYETDDVK